MKIQRVGIEGDMTFILRLQGPMRIVQHAIFLGRQGYEVHNHEGVCKRC